MSLKATLRKLAYPAVRRDPFAYELHGQRIADPYVHLEDPKGEETKAFVAAQNKLFDEFIKDYTHREQLSKRIEEQMNYPRTSAPAMRRGKWFFWHNTGLQNQSVLMRAESRDDPAPSVFLDPNAMSPDGTTALGAAAWSESETLYAYAVAEKGSDWHRIHVRKGDTATDLSDLVDWVKYSGIAWLGDVGFFYTRYPASEAAAADKGAETDVAENPTVFFHRVGTSQEADVEIFRTPENPKWNVNVDVSDCQKYLIAYISDGCEPKNLIRVARVPEGFAEQPVAPEFHPLVSEWEGEYEALGNHGPDFLFTTTKDAKNKKVVNINVDTGVRTDVVPERESVLSFSAMVKDKLLLVYLEDVKHVFYFRVWQGGPEVPLVRVPLPIGSITSLSCRHDRSFVSFKMESFLFAGRSFTFDIGDPVGTLEVFRDDVVHGFDPDAFETKQVFVSSTDGAEIPMFILHKKGIALDATNPTLLYAYGGFNIALTPGFSATRIVFLNNMNGVLAVANIRGGGEYGSAWHDAGRKAKKENCFTDFINCAKYLHEAKYCSPATLAIQGGSNGGLLVAATVNRAPELFASVVSQVGVLDMFKFHKHTIGHAWRSDYGDPDVAEDFEVLQRYSPLHNIHAGVDYPPILCLTGDHDDRVVPLHTLKFVAALQHANPDRGGPFLARVEVAAGHGAGKPTSKRIQEASDTYAFIALTTGAGWFA